MRPLRLRRVRLQQLWAGLPPSTISSTLDRSTYIERRAAVLVHSVEHRPGVLGLSSFFAAQKPNATARDALQSGFPCHIAQNGFLRGEPGARFLGRLSATGMAEPGDVGHGLVDVRLDGLLPFVTTSHQEMITQSDNSAQDFPIGTA